MKILEFLELAPKTKAPLGSQILDSVHMSLGFASEMFGELPAALENNDVVNVAEELGDTEWYIAGYAQTWGLQLPNEVKFTPEEYMDLNYPQTIADLQDLDKKELAYGKVASLEERGRLINQLLVQVEGIAFLNDIDMNDVRAKIIAKLKSRYGDKFNSEGAINRDLTKEREILEGK